MLHLSRGALMHAIARGRSPAELERQQNKHQYSQKRCISSV
jgi:hypothetical protein